MQYRHPHSHWSIPSIVPESIEIHNQDHVTTICATNWPDYVELLAEARGDWAGQAATLVEMEFADGHIL